METLEASNDAGKRQTVTVNIICLDYYRVICWTVIDVIHIYRQVKEFYSSCHKGFCFTSFIFPGLIETDTEWQYLVCGRRSSLQPVKTTMCFVGAWSLRSFRLEGNEVGAVVAPAWTPWQKGCPIWSLTESAFAKHPFGCTGANGWASTALQLLWNMAQLQKKKEKTNQTNVRSWLEICTCFLPLLLSQDTDILVAGLTVCSSSRQNSTLASSIE